MIEINLSPSKKTGSITNVAGIDLSQINVKMMLIAFLFFFIPDGFLADYYDSQISEAKQTYTKLNSSFRKLSSKTRKMSNIQKQVNALDEQEKKLAKKLGAVKKIINKRVNPFLLLSYVAENIPEDVWVKSIQMTSQELILRGYSSDWKSIGAFIENLKNSIFFTKQINYSRPSDIEGEYRGQRVEVFEIKADIVRFK